VVSALERRLDLSLNIADFEKDVDQRLKRLSKNMKMPGFRPGKVPASIVRQQYGEQARHDALSEALGQTVQRGGHGAELRVAGLRRSRRRAAKARRISSSRQSSRSFPEIVLNDLAGVEIERPVLEVGSTEIDGTIDILRKQRVRYELVDRAAARRTG
jgi:trigger factor